MLFGVVLHSQGSTETSSIYLPLKSVKLETFLSEIAYIIMFKEGMYHLVFNPDLTFHLNMKINIVISVQKVLFISDRATRRWSKYFPVRRSPPSRSELDNTF